jgi:solute:Na+ symporter, SSS family
VFWKRLNAKGCLWSMIIGFLVGVFRMLVDTPVTLSKNFHYTEGSLLWIINNINFQYFSILITLISAAVMVVVSYLSPPPDYAKIQNLTFGTVTDEHRAQSAASWGWRELAASAFVLGVILAGYLYFRG